MAAAWTAQLCGLCLALRDEHGQLARVATNYDGLVVSLLVEAQSPAVPARRTAGPCPLRGMRRAPVAVGECVRLAAVVSLALAAAKVRDHVEDRDGLIGAVGVRPAARRVAQRWVRQGAQAGRDLGFDTSVLVAAMDRQAELEAGAGLGCPVLVVTEPTETAVAAAFAHTAVLAGRPANAEALAEVGRLFGRVAHLLDAVEDYREDLAGGKWNPLAATGTSMAAARGLCQDAVLGIELALADVDFTDGQLVHRLLTGELHRAITRTFGGSAHGSCAHTTTPRAGTPYGGQPYGGQPYGGQPYGQGPINFGNQPPQGGYPGWPPPGEGHPQPGPGGGPPGRRSSGCCEGCCCDSCICCGEDACCDCCCDACD